MQSEHTGVFLPEIEERVVAHCMKDKYVLKCVLEEGLVRSDFGAGSYGLIFDTISQMNLKNRQVDELTLIAELEKNGQLGSVGGRGTIDRLVNIDGHSGAVYEYVSTLKDKALRRRVIAAAESISMSAKNVRDTGELVESCKTLITKAVNGSGSRNRIGLSAAKIGEAYNSTHTVDSFLPFHYKMLNDTLYGKGRGSLTIWGGYSSDGKTTEGIASALSAAYAGFSASIYSLEMTEREIVCRILGMETGINQIKIRNRDLTLEESGEIEAAIDRLQKLSLNIYHDSSLTPTQIVEMQYRNRSDLMVIDYLQRFDFTDWKEIPAMAKMFKNLAMNTECCVDLLSQVNPAQVRFGDNPYPAPNLGSLYGGKATAHEADNVVFIYANRSGEHWRRNGTGEVICAKARGGKGEFSFPVSFDSERVKWSEV